MNDTPTPRTDAKHVELQMQDLQIGHRLRELISFAQELERELTESKSWVKSSMESTAIAGVIIALLETERDTLRKMVDAFAECVGHGDEWLMADYRELPHVRARKAK